VALSSACGGIKPHVVALNRMLWRWTACGGVKPHVVALSPKKEINKLFALRKCPKSLYKLIGCKMNWHFKKSDFFPSNWRKLLRTYKLDDRCDVDQPRTGMASGQGLLFHIDLILNFCGLSLKKWNLNWIFSNLTAKVKFVYFCPLKAVEFRM
jgi:hypothetical protein